VSGSDAKAEGRLRPAAHGDGVAARSPLALGGPCDLTLMPVRAPRPTTGTLDPPGPYRLCDIVGGQSFSSIVASADGGRAAVLGVGGQVQVLDARTLAVAATFTRARGAYTAVAISGDGARIAAGAELDGELDVWSVDDHAFLLAAELGPVWPTFAGAVAMTADGTRAAASSGPDTVVADVATGALRRYAENRTCCTSALFFADGDRKLASARHGFGPTGWANGSVALIDLDTGADTLLIQHDDTYGADMLSVSADGSTVLTYRDRVQIWDADSGQERTETSEPEGIGYFKPLGLSADGAQMAVLLGDLGRDGNLWFQHRRTSDGAVVDELRLDPLTGVVGWSPAEILFGRTASTILTSADARAARVLARACSAPQASIDSLSRDGSRLLTLSGGHADVVDARSGAPIQPLASDPPTHVQTMVLSPDGRRLAWIQFPAGAPPPAPLRVEVAGVDDGARATLLGATPVYHFGENLAFSADGSRLAVVDGYNKVLDIFDIEGESLISEQPLAQPYSLFGFTEDGDAVRLAREGVIETLRWQDGSVDASWTYPQWAVGASFDGRTVVATEMSARSYTVYRDGTAIATFPRPSTGCFGGASGIVIAPGGGTVGSGFSCSRAWTSATVPATSIYETATGALVQTLPGEIQAFSWDGSRFAEGALIWCR
jgi:WD40 repeat protein